METLSSEIIKDVFAKHDNVILYYVPTNMTENDKYHAMPIIQCIRATNGVESAVPYLCAITSLPDGHEYEVESADKRQPHDFSTGGVIIKNSSDEVLVIPATVKLSTAGTLFESPIRFCTFLASFFKDPQLEPLVEIGTRGVSFDRPSEIKELEGIVESGTKNVFGSMSAQIHKARDKLLSHAEQVALFYDPRIPVCARFIGAPYPTLADIPSPLREVFMLNACVFALAVSKTPFLGVPTAPLTPFCIYDLRFRNMFQFEQMLAAAVLLAGKAPVLPVVDTVTHVSDTTLRDLETKRSIMVNTMMTGKKPLDVSIASIDISDAPIEP